MAFRPDVVWIASCVNFTTTINQDDIRTGRNVTLPPSFIGCTRYLHKDFQNAITIAWQCHNPDLFITFACNLHWPEITHYLLPNQQPQDRSDSKFHLLLSKLIIIIIIMVNFKCYFSGELIAFSYKIFKKTTTTTTM